MARTWLALRFTKEQFKEIFKFDVENTTEDQFQEIEEYYLADIDYDSTHVYLGEEVVDGCSFSELRRLLDHLTIISNEIKEREKTEIISERGLFIFDSIWR